MLTGDQVEDLAVKMDIPLVFVGFKDELATHKLQYNKSYIINMEDEFDDEGERNDGSHWTAFQVNKYPNGKVEGVYMDSYGAAPPQVVETFCKAKMPYNTKDIQSLLDNFCGFVCLAFLHFINASPCRTQHLYSDAEGFIDLFKDLNKSIDFRHNEEVLKLFFQPKEDAIIEKN